jgi:RimJ/RimL family protein N-acetyltransferase
MSQQPSLETERLILRPFELSDAPIVQTLAGAREIADTTLEIPHPYPEGAAEAWIGSHRSIWEQGTGVTYAITLRHSGELIGAIGLSIDPPWGRGDLGYWIAVAHWSNGFCTEAARAVVDLGFSQLKVIRVQARHLMRNRPSGRVMEKIGMTREGVLRGAVRKWDQFEDVAVYALLAPERTALRR